MVCRGAAHSSRTAHGMFHEYFVSATNVLCVLCTGYQYSIRVDGLQVLPAVSQMYLAVDQQQHVLRGQRGIVHACKSVDDNMDFADLFSI